MVSEEAPEACPSASTVHLRPFPTPGPGVHDICVFESTVHEAGVYFVRSAGTADAGPYLTDTSVFPGGPKFPPEMTTWQEEPPAVGILEPHAKFSATLVTAGAT